MTGKVSSGEISRLVAIHGECEDDRVAVLERVLGGRCEYCGRPCSDGQTCFACWSSRRRRDRCGDRHIGPPVTVDVYELRTPEDCESAKLWIEKPSQEVLLDFAALWLDDESRSISELAELVGVTDRCVCRWLSRIRRWGFDPWLRNAWTRSTARRKAS